MHTDIFSDYNRKLPHSAQKTRPQRNRPVSAILYHCLDFDDAAVFYFLAHSNILKKMGVYMSIELLVQLINLILLVFIAGIIWFGYKTLRKYLKKK